MPSPPLFAISHQLSFPSPATHLAHVETNVSNDGALPASLTLYMAVWTPGSYLVREYARHVEGVATDAPARVRKIRKNAWRIETNGAKSVVVRYRVYANDLTVRTNHVDETHALINGAATFLAIEGHEDAPAALEVALPAGWTIATTMPREAAGTPDRPDATARFVAPDFDTLVDCPLAMGMHRTTSFEALGRAHSIAVWPPAAAADADLKRLTADAKTIFETEAKLFGGELPYDRYQILLHLSPRGRGGLEHRTSATLLASPSSFATREAYVDLLSLVAHEALHLWNVKRIRPAGLTPYRYQDESYTRLLWWFEGATSYYDWRVLRLAKLCTVDEYLEHLANEVAYLDATRGRLFHSLEDASFDAWIKLYRPDENSQNSTVSYYRKGELVCALLDLEMRARSIARRASLDDVLARLWTDYGARNEPVPEDGMDAVFESAAGARMSDLLDAWVRSTTEIDYGATFARVGLALQRSARSDAPLCSLGVRLRNDSGRCVVSAVTRDASAYRAGIDAGDEIVAVGGRRVEGTNVETLLVGRAAGESVDVLVARDGRMLERRATLDGPRLDRVKLVADPDAPADARAAFSAWLGDPHPAWDTKFAVSSRRDQEPGPR
jgi:predicted metalloprotease with PDZ domain